MANESSWRPTAAAVLKITDANGDVVSLRHPTFPYLGVWDSDDPADLRRIVAAYLELARHAFRFADLFVEEGPQPDGTQSDGTDFRPDVPLAWLPLATGPAARPLESLWISRHDGIDASGPLVNRTAIFFALQSAVPNRVDRVLGSRLGIRIVAHVSAEPHPPRTVRITSSSCSSGLRELLGAERAPTPYAPPVRVFFENVFRSGRIASELKESLRAAAGAEVFVNGLRPLGTSEDRALVEVYATVPQEAHGPALALTVRLSAGVDSGGTLDVLVTEVERTPLISNGTLDCDLFLQAPACEAGLGGIVRARPNRSPAELNPFRHHVTLPGLTPSSSEVVLHDDLDQVEVMQSRLVDGTADESQPEHIPLPLDLPHPRTNRFAALSAYQNARGLFDTIRSYGLTPEQFFRVASFPLRIRYRAPMFEGPGRDGRIVNAEVDFDPPLADLIGSVPPTSSDLRPLQVRFGLADLKRSDSRREPLGLCTDPRWSWHEYCHVLLAASTGALELPFAHSAGDALAAILGDVPSRLQDAPRLERRFMRGLTFPWVYLHRSHDHSVFEGWSWSGSYHRQSRFPVSGDLPKRKGYLSEQILSTSLFRLYRALGGDTLDDLGQPDPVVRGAAASYTAYLIMQAILAIGPHTVPPVTPHDFVTALIDADVATLPASSGPLKDKVGGCAHKVITWAFEAQGLDPTVPASAVVDAPGKPPTVDVFIDTRRRDTEGLFPRGGYMPVSLSFTPEPGPEQRSWLALPSAITVRNRKVTVHVRNRGSLNATGVHVRVYWASWPSGTVPPKWNEAGRWHLLTPPGPAHLVRAWPDPGVDFGPFGTLPLAAGRYLILAEASCPGDLSNIAQTSLPCATFETPIIDMVAADNNLGMIVWVH